VVAIYFANDCSQLKNVTNLWGQFVVGSFIQLGLGEVGAAKNVTNSIHFL
jgi:hypothetical protein